MSLKPEILSGIDPKKYFPNSEYIINYAFTIGDRHYFCFDDSLNIPYQRALQTTVYYREMSMNCDAAFLKAHADAFDNTLKQPKITIDTLIELKKLNDQLKLRLTLPKEPELMYKLASVVYFDQNENPATYEFKYGENKIRFWKKNTTLNDFFLQKPLVELIPYLRYAAENLSSFSQIVKSETTQHLDTLLPMLSEEQKMTFKSKSALSPAS